MTKEVNGKPFPKVYPNPAKEKFVIALKGLGKVSVTIFDVLGKPIYNHSTIKETLEIDTNGRFKSGIYLIKVLSENHKVYHTKLVIH